MIAVPGSIHLRRTPETHPMILFWFRSDLRLADNIGLHQAALRARHDGQPLGAVLTLCPGQWTKHDWGAPKAGFVLRAAASLAKDLSSRNIPCRVLVLPRFADVPASLADLCRELKCSNVFANREYEINEVRRDAAVARALQAQGAALHLFHDQCVLPPGSVRTGSAGPYTVYTPFRKRWGDVLATEGLPAALPPPPSQPRAPWPSDPVPSALGGFSGPTHEEHWPASEVEAQARLTRFAARAMPDYLARRDQPGIEGTSTLSPYLSAGLISARDALRAAIARGAAASPKAAPRGKSGPDQWLNELVWREFYRHLIDAFPHLCMGRAFKSETESILWSTRDDHFEAWCTGRTGIPIVDAGMRQLVGTGWMHNRVRMVTAMFLTKNLFIDWRRGEQFFMRHLVDADLAQNNGGWQWSASTGTDAAPYFRVFNPISQSRTHDPEGAFIRRFVPELRDLGPDEIHAPHEAPDLLRARPDYPAPIVDLNASRAAAIGAFRGLAGDH